MRGSARRSAQGHEQPPILEEGGAVRLRRTKQLGTLRDFLHPPRVHRKPGGDILAHAARRITGSAEIAGISLILCGQRDIVCRLLQRFNQACMRRKALRWQPEGRNENDAKALDPIHRRSKIRCGSRFFKWIEEAYEALAQVNDRFANPSAEFAFLCSVLDAVHGQLHEAQECLLITLDLDSSQRMRLRALYQPELNDVWRDLKIKLQTERS